MEKVFTIYGHGGHICRDLDHLNKLLFPHPMVLSHLSTLTLEVIGAP